MVCRVLKVEVVRDSGLSHNLYWGKAGHYKVPTTACKLAPANRPERLLTANLERIAVSDASIVLGQLPVGRSAQFVALADVADLVWHTRRPKDEATYFADMDRPGGPSGNEATLLDLWSDPANRTPQTCTASYGYLATPPVDAHRGALLSRAKQFYELMLSAVLAGDAREFIAPAGTMAHYVGDACQPLHVYRFHHSRHGHPEDSAVPKDYESKLLGRFPADLVRKVNAAADSRTVTSLTVGGDAVADCVVRLMGLTIARLDPATVIDRWIAAKGQNYIADLWAELGQDTAAAIAEGALCLASLWQSA